MPYLKEMMREIGGFAYLVLGETPSEVGNESD